MSNRISSQRKNLINYNDKNYLQRVQIVQLSYSRPARQLIGGVRPIQAKFYSVLHQDRDRRVV